MRWALRALGVAGVLLLAVVVYVLLVVLSI